MRTWDVVLSAAALVVVAMLVGLAGFVGLFSLAFLDYCPPATCSATGATSSVVGGLVAAAGIGVVGLAVTIVRATRRRIAWPFAVGALLLSVLALAGGIAAFASSVGMLR